MTDAQTGEAPAAATMPRSAPGGQKAKGPLPLGVVVGMHRSGTSVITRGLETLGFALGSELMPAHEEINAKGFFEDERLVAINERVLEKAGGLWRRTTRLDLSGVEGERFVEERLDAAKILTSELTAHGRFAFKDPRSSVTLPFWQSVFSAIGTNEGYVIAVRNPLAAARSLDRHLRVPPFKGALLWAQHLLDSLRDTADRPRVIVSYERFIQDPSRELSRMAEVLGRSGDLAPDLERDFIDGFVDPSLKRQHIPYAELRRSGQVPPFCVDLYDLAEELSAGNAIPDLEAELQKARAALQDHGPLLDLDDERDRRMEDLYQSLVRSEGRVEYLEAHVRHLEGVAHERLTTIQDHERQAAGMHAEAGSLRNELGEATDRAAMLSDQAARLSDQRDRFRARADRLQNVVSGRDHALALLERPASEAPHLRAHIGQLEAALAHVQGEARNAQDVVKALQGTLSWKVTAPLRRLSRLVRRKPKPLKDSATGRLARATMGAPAFVPPPVPEPLRPQAATPVARPSVAVAIYAEDLDSLQGKIQAIDAERIRAKLFVGVPGELAEPARQLLAGHILPYKVDVREGDRAGDAHLVDALAEASSAGWTFLAMMAGDGPVLDVAGTVMRIQDDPRLCAVGEAGIAEDLSLPSGLADPLARAGAGEPGVTLEAPFVIRLETVRPLLSAGLTSLDIHSEDGGDLMLAVRRSLAALAERGGRSLGTLED